MNAQATYTISENTRPLISNLIDVNWKIKVHKEENQDEPDYFQRLMELEDEYSDAETLLIEDMGLEGYNNFMAMGRKMFASK